jgi:hypothetical protein
VIDLGAGGHKPRSREAVLEPHRLSWHRESIFDLGINRYPLDILAECLFKKMVELVSAVVTDLLDKETGAYAKPDFFCHRIMKHGYNNNEKFRCR